MSHPMRHVILGDLSCRETWWICLRAEDKTRAEESMVVSSDETLSILDIAWAYYIDTWFVLSSNIWSDYMRVRAIQDIGSHHGPFYPWWLERSGCSRRVNHVLEQTTDPAWFERTVEKMFAVWDVLIARQRLDVALAMM